MSDSISQLLAPSKLRDWHHLLWEWSCCRQKERTQLQPKTQEHSNLNLNTSQQPPVALHASNDSSKPKTKQCIQTNQRSPQENKGLRCSKNTNSQASYCSGLMFLHGNNERRDFMANFFQVHASRLPLDNCKSRRASWGKRSFSPCCLSQLVSSLTFLMDYTNHRLYFNGVLGRHRIGSPNSVWEEHKAPMDWQVGYYAPMVCPNTHVRYSDSTLFIPETIVTSDPS